MSRRTSRETKVWCGTGWTGQPNVIQHRRRQDRDPGGRLRRALPLPERQDRQAHAPRPGDRRPGQGLGHAPTRTGTRCTTAGRGTTCLRVVALDRRRRRCCGRSTPTRNPGGLWNDDWDGAPLMIGDYLLEGGENSWFYVVRLNRHYDATAWSRWTRRSSCGCPVGRAAADRPGRPRRVDRELGGVPGRGRLLRELGWAGPGLGHQRRPEGRDALPAGVPVLGRGRDRRLHRRSTTRATCTWAATSRRTSRTGPTTRDHQIGALMKLDPRKPDHPLVWSVQIGGFEPDGGILGTPALVQRCRLRHGHGGRLVAGGPEDGQDPVGVQVCPGRHGTHRCRSTTSSWSGTAPASCTTRHHRPARPRPRRSGR